MEEKGAAFERLAEEVFRRFSEVKGRAEWRSLFDVTSWTNPAMSVPAVP